MNRLGNIWYSHPEDKYYRPAAIPLDISDALPITLGQAPSSECKVMILLYIVMGLVLGMFLQKRGLGIFRGGFRRKKRKK